MSELFGVEPLESRLLMSTYYVATTGLDSNAGTLASPFRTIQQAANHAKAGDVVSIRAGIYRETVKLKVSGSAGKPITFQPYNNEAVQVNATTRLSGFTSYGNGIYYKDMPWTLGDGFDQVFVDGKMINEARWPNQSVDSVTRINTSTFDTATYTLNSTTGVMTAVVTDDRLTQADGYWNGATIHAAMGSGDVYVTGKVIQSWKGKLKFEAFPNSASHRAKAGDLYYLSGKFQALDAGGEWYRSSVNGRLYIKTPDGSSPNNHVIEVKQRQVTFDLSGRSYIAVKNLSTFGGTILTDRNCVWITLDRLNAQYVSHFTKTEWRSHAGWLTGVTDTGIWLRGTHVTLSNSTVAYSAGNGVQSAGSYITISNNVIHDIDYAGVSCAAINSLWSGTYNDHNVITRNTIYNTARNGIQISGMKNTKVTYNDIYNFGLQTADTGGIYAYDSDGTGTVIAFNRVHDGFNSVLGYSVVGIYLDERSKNYSVHHNLVYNVTDGLTLNGPSTNNKIYNNTILAAGRAVGTIPNKTFSGTVIKNNILTGTISKMPLATIVNNLVNHSGVKFVDRASNNYRLAPGSAGINTGQYIAGITTSIVGGVPDIGTFEYAGASWADGATGDPAPNAPTRLIATSFGSSRIDLRWTDNSQNEKAFYLDRSTDGVTFFPVAKLPANTTVYVDRSVTSSTVYTYRVRADDSPYTATASAQTDWGKGSVIQAEKFSAASGVVVNGNGIGHLSVGDWVRLNDFDFGTGATRFTAKISLGAGYFGRKIEIRAGSTTGKLLGTLNVKPTGAWSNQTEQSTTLTGATGIQDLYLVFKGANDVGNIDWYKFS